MISVRNFFTHSLREGVTHFLQAVFRDVGLTHETSALKLFMVATTVSLEYYTLHSFVPYPTYHFVFRSHSHNENLSLAYHKHIKEFNESNFKAVENK